MPRHSKNNTNSAHFSKAEYNMARDRWGSQTARLGGDSMRSFNSCNLCLAPARDAVACKEGHLYCKECILNDLLAQKTDIARHTAELARWEEEREQERSRRREEARARVLQDFERTSSGVGSGGAGRASGTGSSIASSASQGPSSSIADLPARIAEAARAAEEAAMVLIDAEEREARKVKLPAYWLPSLTPSQKEGHGSLEDMRKNLKTRCMSGSQHGHPISVKSLIDPVIFTHAPRGVAPTIVASPDETSNSDSVALPAFSSASQAPTAVICPSCKRGLNNSTALQILRRCGHVVCATCIKTLVLKTNACVECSVALKDPVKDVITLAREGTGFAARGNATAKAKGTAFQG